MPSVLLCWYVNSHCAHLSLVTLRLAFIKRQDFTISTFLWTLSLSLKTPCPVNSNWYFLKVAVPFFDSYGSLVLIILPHALITQGKHANHEPIVIASQLNLLCRQVLTQLPPKRRQKVVFDISDSSSKDRKVRECFTFFFLFCGRSKTGLLE